MIWLVLLWTLPSSGPSTGRVTLWRRLKRLGALPLPGGGALLPDTADHHEQFTWLLQEIQTAGGEGLLLRATSLGGLPDTALRMRFHAARQGEYLELQILIGHHAAQEQQGTPITRPAFNRLRQQYQDILRLDFFQSPAGIQVGEALRQLEASVQGAHDPSVPRADPAQYQGRTWSTRPQPRVDRLASGWLIRRFIDPHATLAYTDTPGPDDVSFDCAEGNFTHVGPLCTFEVLLQAFDLRDPALRALGEIVHELDVPGPTTRPETPGVDALLRGLWAAELTDLELEAQAHPLFDHLYRALSQEA
jgi:hypothetical protein